MTKENIKKMKTNFNNKGYKWGTITSKTNKVHLYNKILTAD